MLSQGLINNGYHSVSYRSCCMKPALLLMAVLLAGCGFHLRGSADLPAAMSVTFIKGVRPFGTLADDFSVALRLRGVTVTDVEQAATAVLHITQNDTKKAVLSVDTNGNVLEYEIRQSVRFAVADADGLPVVEEQSITLSRDYIFSSTDVLGKQREETVVRAALQESLVNLAMLRIAAAAR
jgi:LPS-assembly lipoprotein